MRWLLIIVSVLLLSIACVYPAGHMMDWGHMDYGYGGLFMFIIILLVLVGIVVYFIVNSKKLKQDFDEENALDILKKRYAKGEISRKEYESMKKDIEG
jgi:putative membrane protein